MKGRSTTPTYQIPALLRTVLKRSEEHLSQVLQPDGLKTADSVTCITVSALLCCGRVLCEYKYWCPLSFRYVLDQVVEVESIVFSQFQSAGACMGTCNGYAFAILQGYVCFQSNLF